MATETNNSTKKHLTAEQAAVILKEALAALERKSKLIDKILEMELKEGQTHLDLYTELVGDIHHDLPKTEDQSK